MLRELLVEVSLIVSVACVLGAVTIVGRNRLSVLADEFKPRLKEVGPYLVVLLAVLALNSAVRDSAQELSWAINLNITHSIAALEGEFVAVIQSFESELLTAYFSAIYVYGYVFLLVFPLLAYVALSERTTLKRLIAAYSLNYFIGLTLYIIFIAYGPRNVNPELFANLLYDTNAQYQFLTSEVNANTNVFPSLHTSLSATVAIFAYKTREEYPFWLAIATVLAVSVVISTMYLGIHWATDVVAGLALAGVCVYLADRYIGNNDLADRFSSDDDNLADRYISDDD